MKAIMRTKYGSPDVLKLREIDKPAPTDNQVLVRVQAAAVNPLDWHILRGEPFLVRLMGFGLLKPKHHILGADMAGRVEAVGKDVFQFKVGDEVFGSGMGGFAEYACARETALIAKPANLTFEQAAAVPQAGVLALQGIRKAGQMPPGQKVLINGAGGGVGTFAIQLAKLCGAEITGVDASHKLDVVRSLGADHVIDYTREDFTESAENYDLIIDCQNYRSMYDIRRTLNPGGTYAMIGGSIPRVYQLWFLSLCAPMTRESRKLRLVAEGPNKGLADLKDLIEAGKLVPVISKTYQLSEVPEALRYFGEGRHKGKIIITMES